MAQLSLVMKRAATTAFTSPQGVVVGTTKRRLTKTSRRSTAPGKVFQHDIEHSTPCYLGRFALHCHYV